MRCSWQPKFAPATDQEAGDVLEPRTAASTHATAMLTNDANFKPVVSFEVLVLEDYL